MIKLKQPLRLSEKLSAFDPESPLSVSDTLQVRLSIPIADQSPANKQNVGRGRLLQSVQHHRHLSPHSASGNVEIQSHTFTTNGERWDLDFAQPVKGVWFYWESDNPSSYLTWSEPRHDETYVFSLFDGEFIFVREYKSQWDMGMYGGVATATAYVTGIY